MIAVFLDNYFDILPGEKEEVKVESTLGLEELQKQIKGLHLEETMR
jgi:hypothetical protein